MLWDKGYDVAQWVTRFTVGNDFLWDTLLLPYDVKASLAHAEGLKAIGLLDADELSAITRAMGQLLEAYEAGTITVRLEDEDCHTVIETFLTKQVGDAGKKIHTGRSRNDQVLAALRLFLRDHMTLLAEQTGVLIEQLCAQAENHQESIMPGYTHMQRAMPSTVALWAGGFAELLLSDLETLLQARTHINTSPLGSAAGYGVPHLAMPRDEVANALQFEDLQRHVSSVQLSRGKLELQAVHAFVQLSASLNRMASDLVLYNTTEFGFVTLPPEFCTGSSIMPQKQNPDVLELIRAQHHRLLAEMNLLLTLPANLPSGYHRDLQLSKEAVMRSVQVITDVLTAMIQLIAGLEWNADALKAAVTPEMFATAVALEQVKAGKPFRDAYREAAASLNSMTASSKEEALHSYQTPGDPGNVQPQQLRDLLQKIKSSF